MKVLHPQMRFINRIEPRQTYLSHEKDNYRRSIARYQPQTNHQMMASLMAQSRLPAIAKPVDNVYSMYLPDIAEPSVQ